MRYKKKLICPIFICILILTIIVIICPRQLLNLYNLNSSDIESSIGGYISTMLGGILGVILTMVGTIFIDRTNREKEEEALKREKLEEIDQIKRQKANLLYYDLQILFRKCISENWIKNQNKLHIEGKDHFYNDLDEIYKNILISSFEEILTNKERIEILTFINIEDKKSEEEFIKFLSSDKLKILNKTTGKILENYKKCNRAYNECYEYLKNINMYIDRYKCNNARFYDNWLYNSPLIKSLNNILNLNLNGFLQQLVFEKKYKIGYMYPGVDNKESNEEIVCCFPDCEKFEIEYLKEVIGYYDNEGKYKENKENDYQEKYKEYMDKNEKIIREKINKCRNELIKKIIISDGFYDVINRIKESNPLFLNEVDNGDYYFEKVILNKETPSRTVLNNISYYLYETFLNEELLDSKDILVNICNGKPKYIKFNLNKNIIQYRKEEYFDLCECWNSVCDLFDFDLANEIFNNIDYINYISNRDNLEYVYYPNFRESVFLDDVRNIFDLFDLDESIVQVIKRLEALKTNE